MFGPTDSDVADILRNTDSGASFDYDARTATVVRHLKECFRAYQSGESEVLDREKIVPYSHPRLVRRLADWLNEIAA